MFEETNILWKKRLVVLEDSSTNCTILFRFFPLWFVIKNVHKVRCILVFLFWFPKKFNFEFSLNLLKFAKLDEFVIFTATRYSDEFFMLTEALINVPGKILTAWDAFHISQNVLKTPHARKDLSNYTPMQ